MATPTTAPRTTLTFPATSSTLLSPYLPPSSPPTSQKPHLTLTYATSLDSSIALSPTIPTPLSGPATKSMTHFLRRHHAAILVGAGTATADDPSLNCRLEGAGGHGGRGLEGQPRPVVLDARGSWAVSTTSKVVELAGAGLGRGPWVLVGEDAVVAAERIEAVERVGGRFVRLPVREDGRFGWDVVMRVLGEMGVQSVMVEGGASVINEMLEPRWVGLVDVVIVTVAPVFLGEGGVRVAPRDRRDGEGGKVSVRRLRDVKWVPMDEDVVLCGRPVRD